MILLSQMGPASLQASHDRHSVTSEAPVLDPIQTPATTDTTKQSPGPPLTDVTKQSTGPALTDVTKQSSGPPLTDVSKQCTSTPLPVVKYEQDNSIKCEPTFDMNCPSPPDTCTSPKHRPKHDPDSILRGPELMRKPGSLDNKTDRFVNNMSSHLKNNKSGRHIDKQKTPPPPSRVYTGKTTLSEVSLRQLDSHLPQKQLSPSERIREWQRKCMESHHADDVIAKAEPDFNHANHRVPFICILLLA